MRDDLTRLGIALAPVEQSTTELHLHSFVDRFLVEPTRVRVRNVIRRQGWRAAASRGLVLPRLDTQLCVLDERHSRPDEFPPQYRRAGVYIDDEALGLSMTLEQASRLSQKRGVVGLYSIEPGRLAVLFNNEWGVWYCCAPD
ncbi:MAG: hypothetical protein H6835_08905 [Planctomycetes bacterium]|nr:hypothetical protein [Planctomycetota bacterium]